MTAKLIQQSKHLFPATGCVGLTAFDAGPRQCDLIEERIIAIPNIQNRVGKGFVAKYTWEWPGNVQIHCSVIYQAANGSPKRLPMALRTVLGPGYTGWCLACLETAVVSTGGRCRPPPAGSRAAHAWRRRW